MTDKDDKSQQESSQDEAEGPIGGERLANARREQQITVHEIAKELHLDEYKVRALEANDFELLGAPVFAKGHLKKYAQLVNIDEADVLTDYYQLTRSVVIPPVISSRPRPRKEMSPAPWIAVIVIIVIVVSAYWWFTSRPLAIDTPTPELLPQESAPQESMPQEPMPGEQQAPDADVSDDALVLVPAGDEPVADEPVADEPVVEAAAAPQPAPAEGDGQLRLLITYSGDCWTEISDASGRRLFFGLGTDGRTVELNGAAPFNVLFGDADNVGLEVNGAEFAIPASARRGRTARLTISGS